MVGEDRPTTTPAEQRSQEGDPFGGLAPGSQVGKYEIVEMLGQGGFGITYRARDSQLHRDVALKEYLPTSFAIRRGDSMVLPRSTQTAENFLWGRARFLDEARTLARLEAAPGIVTVHDFLEANGTAYMVMTLVRGETLEARLKRDRRLPQPAIEQLLYPLLDGLEIVHEAGFLHRDIKPANILLDANGRPTLIDFGASREALQGRTQAMTAVYTPGYAAFEQFTSARQGPWTDIYALAGTLYHCVSGRTAPGALDRVHEDTLVPAMEVGTGRYAPSLLAAIDAGLKLKAAERPQSIAEWRRVLSGLGAGRPSESLSTPTRDMEAPPTRRMRAEAPAPRPRRRALPWIAAGIVALALAGGGAWLFLRPPAESTEQTLRRIEADARRQTELAQKLRQEEEARQRTVADAARRAEAEAARKVAEEKAATEEAARRQTEEAERQRAAAEAARRQADAEAARKAAEEKAAADAVARRKAAEEMASRAEAEAARRRAEEQARAEAEARRRAQQEEAARRAAAEKAAAEAEAKRRAEEEARTRAEAETQRRAEQERRAAEEKARAEAAARDRAEAEARARAEQEDRRKAEEERARAEAESKRQAEAAEAALRLAEPDRKRIQVALTSLGFDTRGSDGTFGARSRQMIAAWQKSRGQTETGYLTAPQLAALRQQAAAAIAKFDEEQKKLDDDKRKAEEEAKRKEEQARTDRILDQVTKKGGPAPQEKSVAAAPPPATSGRAVYVGVLKNKTGAEWRLVIRQDGTRLQFELTSKFVTGSGSLACQPTDLRPDGRFFTPCRAMGYAARTLDGTLQSARLTGEGDAGGGVFTLTRQ